MTSGRQREVSMARLSDVLAITATCIFIFLAAYRIELPGLYYDELAFVNAAQGAPDNTFIYMRLGPVPLLVFPFIGALKAWIYTPIFGLFGVSALTIRLPVILIAAVTLLIFYQLMRAKLGAVWATIAVWIMAVDPANLFPRWISVILVLIAVGATLYLVLPLLLHFHLPTIRARTTGIQVKWDALVNTLSGFWVARRIFGDAAGVIRFTSTWLIAVDGFLALACLFFPMLDAEARKN